VAPARGARRGVAPNSVRDSATRLRTFWDDNPGRLRSQCVCERRFGLVWADGPNSDTEARWHTGNAVQAARALACFRGFRKTLERCCSCSYVSDEGRGCSEAAEPDCLTRKRRCARDRFPIHSFSPGWPSCNLPNRAIPSRNERLRSVCLQVGAHRETSAPRQAGDRREQAKLGMPAVR
jgi:hypothetical protein